MKNELMSQEILEVGSGCANQRGSAEGLCPDLDGGLAWLVSMVRMSTLHFKSTPLHSDRVCMLDGRRNST